MGLNSGLARAKRTLVLAASSDTYLLASLYSGGVVNANFPSNRYVLMDVSYYGKFQWSFNGIGTVTAPSITVYGTNDPLTAAGGQGAAGLWFVLPAPAEQTGTGSVVNPITAVDGSQTMQYNDGLLAWRIVTSAFAGGGSVQVSMVALP